MLFHRLPHRELLVIALVIAAGLGLFALSSSFQPAGKFTEPAQFPPEFVALSPELQQKCADPAVICGVANTKGEFLTGVTEFIRQKPASTFTISTVPPDLFSPSIPAGLVGFTLTGSGIVPSPTASPPTLSPASPTEDDETGGEPDEATETVSASAPAETDTISFSSGLSDSITEESLSFQDSETILSFPGEAVSGLDALPLLSFAGASVTISSSPSGADIYQVLSSGVQTFRGRTTHTRFYDSGTYNFVLKKTGFKDTPITITVGTAAISRSVTLLTLSSPSPSPTTTNTPSPPPRTHYRQPPHHHYL